MRIFFLVRQPFSFGAAWIAVPFAIREKPYFASPARTGVPCQLCKKILTKSARAVENLSRPGAGYSPNGTKFQPSCQKFCLRISGVMTTASLSRSTQLNSPVQLDGPTDSGSPLLWWWGPSMLRLLA